MKNVASLNSLALGMNMTMLLQKLVYPIVRLQSSQFGASAALSLCFCTRKLWCERKIPPPPLALSYFLILCYLFVQGVEVFSDWLFLCSYILRRPQSCMKSLPYIWLLQHRTNLRWRFRKILWPSQNVWNLKVMNEFKS